MSYIKIWVFASELFSTCDGSPLGPALGGIVGRDEAFPRDENVAVSCAERVPAARSPGADNGRNAA